MPDYKKMYHMLFNKITDVVEQLNQAQLITEEIFVEQEENKISHIPICNENDINKQ